MNNDDNMPWIIVALVGLFVFYKISQTDAALSVAQINANTAAQNNLWLTVPGAVGAGLSGIGSVLSGFDNLFTDNSLTD